MQVSYQFADGEVRLIRTSDNTILWQCKAAIKPGLPGRPNVSEYYTARRKSLAWLRKHPEYSF
jgi:hypothetical protein